jgi:hypothetical protein
MPRGALASPRHARVGHVGARITQVRFFTKSNCLSHIRFSHIRLQPSVNHCQTGAASEPLSAAVARLPGSYRFLSHLALPLTYTHPPTHSLIHSPTHHPPTRSLTPPLPHPPTHPPTHSLTHHYHYPGPKEGGLFHSASISCACGIRRRGVLARRTERSPTSFYGRCPHNPFTNSVTNCHSERRDTIQGGGGIQTYTPLCSNT